MKGLWLLLVFLVLVAASLPGSAQDPKPDRVAFLHEVLEAQPTDVTPKFDAYHQGSYDVEKQDVLNGLIEECRTHSRKLRGVVIAGPVGPLWAYYVIVFLEESADKVRVNSLVMPHARITAKATGIINVKACTQTLANLLQTGALRPELPAQAQTFEPKSGVAYDFRYELLMASWRPKEERPQVDYGMLTQRRNGGLSGGESREVKAFTDQLNTLLHGLKKTYPVEKK